ncbi:MAG: hypothetical protein ABR507_02230 [Actinomycetota bacterium]|nr:hypothetical protein [Actinomycetota bacterium]
METSQVGPDLNLERSRPFSEGIVPGLTYVAFRMGAFIAEHVPIAWGDASARLGAAIAYRVSRNKRNIVTRNLARVIGEGPLLKDAVKQAYVSYAEYWLETFRLGRYSREEIMSMIEADEETIAAVTDSLATGKGVVLATAHLGFYDLGVAWVGQMGWPFTTVAEVLKPRALFDWFAGTRDRNGMHVIPAKPGSAARERLIEVVRSGEGVAILADRDLSRRGLWARLFGERTTLAAGPPLVLVETGAPLIAGAVYKVGPRRFKVIFEKVPYELTGDRQADLDSLASVMASQIERFVREAPAQWHLFSTNWPSDEAHLTPRGRD